LVNKYQNQFLKKGVNTITDIIDTTNTRVAKKTTRIQTENTQRVLEAALQVFAAHGFRGSTVEQIAKVAGMSKANVLYYFRRKQDMYVAVLTKTIEDWLSPLQTLNPAGDPHEELWRYAQAKLQMSREAPAASKLFANEVISGAPMIASYLQNELRPLVNHKCTIIQRWIDQGLLAPIDPLHLLFFIWSTTQHYADFMPQIEVLHDLGTDRLFNDAEHTLKQLLITGLQPPKR